MKYIKTFENQEELPKSLDIDFELNQLRELKEIRRKSNDNYYLAKEDEIEKIIWNKLYPIVMKYCDRLEFENAKWFVGRSYKDMVTSNKVLLFRVILIRENEILGKYNL